MRKIFSYFWVLLIGVQFAHAQQNQSSPFSYFGIGDVYTDGLAFNRSLSGLGIGLNSSYYLNGINPAGLCAMDTMSFTFELGTSGSMSQLQSGSVKENSFHGNVDYIAIGFPVTRWMKASIGFNPLTNVGYNLKSYQSNADESVNIERTIAGEGGISQIYMNTSVTVLKKISLGFHVAYYFGNITNVLWDEPVEKNISISSFLDSTKTSYNDWYTSFGLQYSDKINDDYRFTVGLIGGLEQKINNIYTSSKRSLSKGHPKGLLLSEVRDKESFDNLPFFYGVGFSISNEKMTYGFDYTFHNWGNVQSGKAYQKFFNEHSFVLGMQYLPRPRTATKYRHRIRYRASVRYKTNYLGLFDEQIKEIGINFGVGLPVKRSKSTLNLSLGVGKIGTLESTTLNQNFVNINIDLSLHDIWFIKRKYD